MNLNELIAESRRRAEVGPDVSDDAFARLVEAENQALLDYHAEQLSRCWDHYSCDGDHPVPVLPWRRRASLWLRSWLWWRPWAFVHRILPGECECEGCDW